jgi:hypothetical protein
MCEVEGADIVRRERALARQDGTSGVKGTGRWRLGDSSAVLCKRGAGKAPRLGSEKLCNRRDQRVALAKHEEYIRIGMEQCRAADLLRLYRYLITIHVKIHCTGRGRVNRGPCAWIRNCLEPASSSKVSERCFSSLTKTAQYESVRRLTKSIEQTDSVPMSADFYCSTASVHLDISPNLLCGAAIMKCPRSLL